MKILNLITIELSEDDLKSALANYLSEKYVRPDLAKHLLNNSHCLEWDHSNKSWHLSIDNYFKESNTENNLR